MANKDFANDRFEGIEGRKMKARKWKELMAILNSNGGAVKSVDQWQKYWADQKREAKKHAANVRLAAEATGGGGPRVRPLTNVEEHILEIINPVSAYRISGLCEGGDFNVSITK